MNVITEVFRHSLLETAKLLPFLFLAYLLMEFLERHSGKNAENLLKRCGKFGPLFGAVLGAFPQCGFSAAAAGLYSGRLITAGTLLAVFLSTSDEMLPILISNGVPASFILVVLGMKISIGIVAGFAVDMVFHVLHLDGKEVHPAIEDLCEREHCNCGENFVISALKHTVHILIFLLLVTFGLNILIEMIGKEVLASFILDRPLFGNVLAALMGLIPNCASSAVLTELYLSDVIGIGAMLSGLLVNAGVGTLVLFQNNHPLTDSLKLLLVLFGIGVISGCVIDLMPLSGWLNLFG